MLIDILKPHGQILITGTIRVFWQKVFLSLFVRYFFLGIPGWLHFYP